MLKIESNDIKNCLWTKFSIQSDSIILYDRIYQIIHLIHNSKGYTMIIIWYKFYLRFELYDKTINS